jgi:hypothetical protein
LKKNFAPLNHVFHPSLWQKKEKKEERKEERKKTTLFYRQNS